MPEFQLDTGGQVAFEPIRWSDLDAFTQGYIKALFFTDCETMQAEAHERHGNEGHALDLGFSDLAPETLARIIADCEAFQASRAWADTLEGYQDADEEHAGRDFWYTRNGHGCGFWDGDWPEPYATQLDEAAKAFGEVDAYLGDDGKIYL